MNSLVNRVRERLKNHRIPSHHLYSELVKGKCGLEIGGPSWPFQSRGIIPLYRYPAHLDQCNFSSDNIWEAKERNKDLPPGRTIIAEICALPCPDASYDFVLASHVLEHSANPIKALHELKRVARRESPIIVVLPHYRYTFDHKRNPTPVPHLLEDFHKNLGEDDLSHLDEILKLHDLSRDPWAGGPENFRKRSANNLKFRALHHHVFDESNAAAMLLAAGVSLCRLEFVPPIHIVLLGKN